MPKQQSRTRSNRKTKGGGYKQAASAPVWALTSRAPELKTFIVQNGNYQLYHNVASAMHNLASLCDSIVQGTGVNQRIGNRIHVKSLRVRLVFNNKVDRPNVSYRIACTAAPTATNADSFSELFSGSGPFTGLHVPTNSNLLYDTVFPLNQGSGMEIVASSKERSFNHTFEIPINHPVVYNTADGKCTTALVVWFVPFDAWATVITDNIASVPQVTWAIDYLDS